jgi:hypothetical protein
MAQARRVSGSRVGKGTIRSANPRIGKVSGGRRGTTVHMAGFKEGLVGGKRINPKLERMANEMTSDHLVRSFQRAERVGSSVRKTGSVVGRGATHLFNMETGTLGGTAVVGLGALGAGALVERQHAKKALTAKQLQQRRMAAKSKRTPRSGRV